MCSVFGFLFLWTELKNVQNEIRNIKPFKSEQNDNSQTLTILENFFSEFSKNQKLQTDLVSQLIDKNGELKTRLLSEFDVKHKALLEEMVTLLESQAKEQEHQLLDSFLKVLKEMSSAATGGGALLSQGTSSSSSSEGATSEAELVAIAEKWEEAKLEQTSADKTKILKASTLGVVLGEVDSGRCKTWEWWGPPNSDGSKYVCITQRLHKAKETKEQGGKGDCVVLSIGLGNVVGFENDAVERYGCTVIGFDHTISERPSSLHSDVVWEKFGLGSEAQSETQPQLISLKQMLNMLGQLHKERGGGGDDVVVDLVKMDCEGCEWEVFTQLSQPQDSKFLFSSSIEQLLLEIHIGWGKWRQSADKALLFLYQNNFELVYKEWNPWSIAAIGTNNEMSTLRDLLGPELAGTYEATPENFETFGKLFNTYSLSAKEYWLRQTAVGCLTCCYETVWLKRNVPLYPDSSSLPSLVGLLEEDLYAPIDKSPLYTA